MDRCDVLDVLEESVTLRRSVTVELKGGRHFVDQARDVVTPGKGEAEPGEWVQFRDHGQVAVADIAFCAPAEPREPTYASKT
jgi:transcriptional antiterminator Rof (Rho-off)